MQNLFGILNSQSRYELQTKFLFNPNGLVVDADNRFGIVDGSGNISSISNLAHKKGTLSSINQATLSSQPQLINSAFGSKKGIENTVPFVFMESSSDSFKPEIFQEYWIAFKCIPNSSGRFRNSIFWYGELSTNSGQCYFDFDSTNALFRIQFITAIDSPFVRRNKSVTVPAVSDGSTEHNLIIHISGTDDVNDWKLYNGTTELTKTIVSNESFTGQELYRNLNVYRFRLLASLSTSQAWYDGKVGKFLGNYGAPNVAAINAALNAETI